jgi:hypothetical protein
MGIMNEKFKELSRKSFLLAHEANDLHEQEEGEELSQTEFGNVFNQKFAELIVRECISQCEKIRNDAQFLIQNGDVLTESGRMLHEGVWGGAANCAHAIQQHFGVEQ